MQEIDKAEFKVIKIRNRGMGIGFLALFLFLFMLAPGAYAYVCTDCHGSTGPHGTGCQNTSCAVSCHPNKLNNINHPSGTGTPLAGDLSSAEGITTACRTCHVGPNTTHPYIINTNPIIITAGTDLDYACGQCHGGSGSAKPGVFYFTRAQLSGGALGMHTGGSSTNTDCLVCHSTLQGTVAAIIPGTNHHDSIQNCIVCHSAGHISPLPGTTNSDCEACHTAGGPNGPAATHHVTASACNKCHTYPGVAPAAACTTCHTIGGPNGPAATHHVTPSSCNKCHTYPGVSPAAACLTCHTTGGPNGPAATPRWNMDTTTHAIQCSDCHVNAGVRPVAGTTVCNPCHGGSGPGKPLGQAEINGDLAGMHAAAPPVDNPPTAAGTLTCPTGWAASVTDNSSDDNPGLTVTVLWGDGLNSSVANHGTVNHTYTMAGTYVVSIKAVDSKGQIATTVLAGTCTAALYSIGGNTRNHADTANLGSVGLVLRNFNTVQSCTTSPAISLQTSNAITGAYSFANFKPGRYGICASKAGYTFPVTDLTVGPTITGQKIIAN